MSGCSIKVAFLWLFCLPVFLLSGSFEQSEDALLMNAIVSEESGDLHSAMNIYKYMYEESDKYIYLVQGARDVLAMDVDPSYFVKNMQKCLDVNPENQNPEFIRILVALYIKQGDVKRAERISDKYLSFTQSLDDQLAKASLKDELGDPKSTLVILGDIYKKDPSDGLVIEMARLMDDNNMSEQNPVALLESHIAAYIDTSVDVYFKLIDIYAKQQNTTRMLELYKELYRVDEQEYYMKQIVELSLYEKDYDGAISFLKEGENNEIMIFSFYKEKGDYAKATHLARELYAKNSDPKWIAEEAMLVYEQLEVERKVDSKALNNMQNTMNKAIFKGLKEPVYLNYYGYVLIDKNVDIPRGVELVKKALQTDGENPYYLDSLAWGLYKLGNCPEAYRIMLKVLYKEGYVEPDIIEHWGLIDKCTTKQMKWK